MPESRPVALLLVDVVNAFDFDGGGALLRHAEPASRALADLARRARAAGAPVIYANDNYGEWREDFGALVERCTQEGAAGAEVVRRVRPRDDDFFVLKPTHSGFYQTSLDALLRHLGVRTLVVGGYATDICVLATATDAGMRDLGLVVPQDASAAETERAHTAALVHLRRVLHAATPPAAGVDFDALVREASEAA